MTKTTNHGRFANFPCGHANLFRMPGFEFRIYSALLGLFFLAACNGKPNQANIALRKQVQTLEFQKADLERQHGADQATIKALQQQRGTLQTLPQERLDQLFTAHGVSIGRLSGGAEFDRHAADDDGIKVYVVPTDQTGDELKAAGTFVVELFDLQQQSDNVVGRWEFANEQVRQSWNGQALLYTYVLTCPWQRRRPMHGELTLRVTFRDELTQREFSAQRIVNVKVATAGTTSPATMTTTTK